MYCVRYQPCIDCTFWWCQRETVSAVGCRHSNYSMQEINSSSLLCQGNDNNSIQTELIRRQNIIFPICHAYNHFRLLRIRSVTESSTDCIPKSDGNLYIAATPSGRIGPSLADVWWNNSRRSTHTSSSNKWNANSITATATLANCNASLEFAANEALHRRRREYRRRWSHSRNAIDGEAGKHRMTIGNTQGRRYGPVNAFRFSIFYFTRCRNSNTHNLYYTVKRRQPNKERRLLISLHIHDKNYAKYSLKLIRTIFNTT